MKPDPSFVPVDQLRRSPRYWQSLAERRGETPVDTDHEHDPEPPDVNGESRRQFMSLMAASLALAGTAGCTRQPPEAIMPYVDPPEHAIPGRPKFYATAAVTNGIGLGVLVESHLGRPTKVEGNPKHPASLGSTDVHAQSCLLDLYDPDRAKIITRRGQPQSWDDFLIALQQLLPTVRGDGRLRILSETVISPVLGAQIQSVLTAFPGSRWHQYDPAGSHSAREGSQRAFGRQVNTYYRLDRADVIVSLDSDFLASGPGSTRYARDFADRRRIRGSQTTMNRLYAVESVMSSTGGKADHRFPIRYDEMEQFGYQLLSALNGGATGAPARAQAIARDLAAHRGKSAVIPGEYQSPAVHAIAHAINGALGNTGVTVIHTDPLEVRPEDQLGSLGQLIADMKSGAVEVLLILGGNPVYNAPSDWDFRDALQKVAHSIHVSSHLDETSAWCEWHIPENHFLEDWGDARGYDGTLTIQQPLLLPLYESRSQAAVLDAILQNPGRSTYQIVRDYWAKQSPGDFEGWWRQSVREGIVAGSALPALTVTAGTPPAPGRADSEQIGIVFRPDPYLYDGRFSNNAWLKELPRPITKLMWDNAVIMSAATARKNNLQNHEVVEVRSGGRTIQGPVWILPGMPEKIVVVLRGVGRRRAGR
jgi:molybdopterin-containing oxidoreductase family iron-sulfur binding subunit